MGSVEEFGACGGEAAPWWWVEATPPSPDSVVCVWKLVRPGMQIPARMPRAALNPSIPPPNTAAAVTSAVVGGPPMAQQVSVAREATPSAAGRIDRVCATVGPAAFNDVIALAGASGAVHVTAAAALAAASRVTAQLSQVRLRIPGLL